MVEGEDVFWLVDADERLWPTADHVAHGYEDEWDYYNALRELRDNYDGRVGEQIGERHGFRRLRFHDTPGHRPDEVWLPDFMLQPAKKPDWLIEIEEDDRTEAEKELDRALGVDD